MNISGPSPLSGIQRPDDLSGLLRQNQRFAAEVLQVSGDRVVLNVEGVRFVARLTSSEQAASLMERRFGQFVVRENKGSMLVLQLINPGTSPLSASAGPSPDLVASLLKQAGQPVNEMTSAIGKALLLNGLPLTTDILVELQSIFTQLDKWSAQDVYLAATLKSMGLPLSAGIVSLFRGDAAALGQLFTDLQAVLKEAFRGRLTPSQDRSLREALNILQGLVLPWDESEGELAASLRGFVRNFGRTVEGSLAERLAHPQKETGPSDSAAYRLALLGQVLAEIAPHDLGDRVENLIDALRQRQFLNVEPDEDGNATQWLKLEIPLMDAGAQAQPGVKGSVHTAMLRVAYSRDGEKRWIDARNTQFVVCMHLDAEQAVEVEVSLVGNRIGARVLVSDPALQSLAEYELDGFRSSLERCGYQVQSLVCQVGKLERQKLTESRVAWRSFSEVSVEA